MLGGGSALTATPATAPTTGPTATSGSSGFTDAPRAHLTPLPASTAVTSPTPAPGSGTVPVVVAGTSITNGGTWIYDPVNSTPDELAYFDNDALTWGFFGYRTIADPTGETQLALRTFNEAYVGSLGATNERLVAEQTLPGGQAWALYTLDLGGQPVVLLTYAGATATAGQVSLQWIFTGVPEFNATLADVQVNIQIDGVPAFSGLDPTAVSELLGG